MGFWEIVEKIAYCVKDAVEEYESKKSESYSRWYSYYERREREELKREYNRFKSGEISQAFDRGSRFGALVAICKERGYIE